jgi:CubicO group peptidase (beta-lactamase class C family)
MRHLLLAAAAAALLAAPAAAQQAVKPGVPSILQWSPEQQKAWYPAIEQAYRVNTIKAGTAQPLPKAGRQLPDALSDAYMAQNNVSGFLVLKDGKVVAERYGLGRKPQDRWTSFSVAKSVTSTLVGAAIADGKIKGEDALVTDYIPELKGSGYDGVTVRQLLMMSSGVRWNEDYTDPNSDVARAGAAITEPGVNPLVSYMRKLPRANEPGTKFTYNTGETDLVGILVSNAVGKSLSEYASEKIWKPYGMERDAVWVTDLAGHERGGCCISMTLRDYGRLGQFMLDGGKAAGKQVVPPEFVTRATTPQIKTGAPERGYGYFWWMPVSGAFEGRGIFGQSVTVFPEDRIVIVLNAAWPEATKRERSMARTAFINSVHEAAKGL